MIIKFFLPIITFEIFWYNPKKQDTAVVIIAKYIMSVYKFFETREISETIFKNGKLYVSRISDVLYMLIIITAPVISIIKKENKSPFITVDLFTFFAEVKIIGINDKKLYPKYISEFKKAPDVWLKFEKTDETSWVWFKDNVPSNSILTIMTGVSMAFIKNTPLISNCIAAYVISIIVITPKK